MHKNLRGAVLLAIACLGMAGCFGSDSEKLTPGSQIVTEQQLEEKAAALGYPIYWLGPIEGKSLEYTSRADGRIFVRYIPGDAVAGTQDRYLTVGTYPMEDAFKVVTGISKTPDARVKELDNGLAAAAATKPESVFVAFKGQDLQIEVYDPDANAAFEAATSSDLQQVK